MSSITRHVSASLVLLLTLPTVADQPTALPSIPFPFQPNDRVAWIGSSSTRIGVWPKTLEFLLRTRHADLHLTLSRHTTGGGTFATGLQNLDKWLAESKPTIVFFNYGGNDAKAGEKSIADFHANMTKCVEKVRATGARVVLIAHQGADARHIAADAVALRHRYAEDLLAFAKEKGWPVIDAHHPTDALQLAAQQSDPDFTINKDAIHLTDPAYVAWGFYLYQQMSPPPAESSVTIGADGKVTESVNCQVTSVARKETVVTFLRADKILPILPPAPLPPRKLVPLEQFSRYMLTVKGLASGEYRITCENQPVGVASAEALDRGVNLNSLVLDSGNTAPWQLTAVDLWSGQTDALGKTKWRFDIRRR